MSFHSLSLFLFSISTHTLSLSHTHTRPFKSIQKRELHCVQSSGDDFVKRPLFVTTVPRGIFLQPQPIVREIVAKARQIFTYASHPRILDQRQRREILSKQSSINSTFNQILNRNNVNLISKNIKSFDDQVDARCERVDNDSMCKVTGVKIARTRYDAFSSFLT
jgi:hypothetical protein